VSKSIYIFNHIIFEDKKVWDFKKIQKNKSDESTSAYVHKTFSACDTFFTGGYAALSKDSFAAFF
jgi:hypothetical protein